MVENDLLCILILNWGFNVILLGWINIDNDNGCKL